MPPFIKQKNSRRSYSISKHRSQPESCCFRNAYICVFNYTSIAWEIHHHRRTPVLTSYCMTSRTSILCENLYTIGVSLNQRGVHPLLNVLAGVTRIELASAVLETVALPLCYTPICALILLHKTKKYSSKNINAC